MRVARIRRDLITLTVDLGEAGAGCKYQEWIYDK
jgi:hypothetical protein